MTFDADRLAAAIPGVVYLPETDSTNRVARGQAVGTVVVADHQTAGRGRLDRQWDAEPGKNLLFSVVRPAPAELSQAPRLCLLWAAAMARALDLHVKWPNDLVDRDGAKAGGLLAEIDEGRIVLGVGINVNQRSFPGKYRATSLALLRGGPQDRIAVLSMALQAIEAVHPDDSLDGWRARSITLGRRVSVGDREGLASSVREDGALIVDGQAVLAGDVALLG